MITEKVNGHRLRIYDSIEILPALNFQAYNKAVMLDAGIGSTVNDADRHLGAILRYNEKGDKVALQRTVTNLRQCIAFVISKTSPKMQSFAALVHTIDGKENTDLSDTGLEEMVARIAKTGITVGRIGELLRAIKKK